MCKTGAVGGFHGGGVPKLKPVKRKRELRRDGDLMTSRPGPNHSSRAHICTFQLHETERAYIIIIIITVIISLYHFFIGV